MLPAAAHQKASKDNITFFTWSMGLFTMHGAEAMCISRMQKFFAEAWCRSYVHKQDAEVFCTSMMLKPGA